jgi:polyhydroxyalkanoate synthesis repressor PhaR
MNTLAMKSDKTIHIKKYENRRLYDATNSRYVNLDEVAKFVQLGHDVQVIDVASGEDITRVILTQIIAEGAKTPDSGFPLDVLKQMVIASGRAGQESAIRYAKAMMDLYQSTYKEMTPTLNAFDFMQGAGSEAGRTDPKKADVPALEKNGSRTEDVDILKQRLEKLEKVVASFTSKDRPKKRAKPVSGSRRKD